MRRMRPWSRYLLCVLLASLVSCALPDQATEQRTSATLYFGDADIQSRRIGRSVAFQDVQSVTVDVFDNTTSTLLYDNTSLQRFGNLWSLELDNLTVTHQLQVTGYAFSTDPPQPTALLFSGTTAHVLQASANNIVLRMAPHVPADERDFPQIVGISRPDSVLPQSTHSITVLVDADDNDSLRYTFSPVNDPQAQFSPVSGNLSAVDGVNLLQTTLTVGNQTGAKSYRVVVSNQDGLEISTDFPLTISETVTTAPSLTFAPVIQTLSATRENATTLRWTATATDDDDLSQISATWTFSNAATTFDNFTSNAGTFTADLDNYSDAVIGTLNLQVTDGDSLTSTLSYFLREGLFPVGSTVLFADRQRLSAGQDFTCAVLPNGAVNCWGNNAAGQLGDGTNTNSSNPTPVLNLSQVREVSAGAAHVCALRDNGTVACWGSNSNGQLGDGSSTNHSVPVNASVSGVRQISAGADFSCALLDNASVYCWGQNNDGQLGDGTTTSRPTPTAVSGLGNARQVSAGTTHACALFDNGTAACWGSNEFGQLGNDTTGGESSTPVAVVGLSSAQQVVAGSGFSCALLDNATVQCWGQNNAGQLGDGTTASRPQPQTVSGLSAVTSLQIATDNRTASGHVCALLRSGAAYCWGANNHGQLGIGSSEDRTRPQAIAGLSDVAQLGLGGTHSCALSTSGTVECWGENNSGQLGDGTNTARTLSAFTGIASLNLNTDSTAPEVLSFSPVDNASVVEVQPEILVTFNDVLRASTATVTDNTSCVGSFQLSLDNFSTCVPLTAPTLSADGRRVSFQPASNLSLGTYQVRVTTAVEDASGNALAAETRSTFRANTFAGGAGTLANPFLIADEAQLGRMQNDLSAHYQLANSLTLSSSPWAPIGDNVTPFLGSLNGDNFTITGLSLSSSAQDDVGLFGVLGSGSSVQSLYLQAVSVAGRSAVGGLAGRSENATIADVSVAGSVSGNSDFIGGLVGFATDNTRITRAASQANVSTATGAEGIGGLVGVLDNGSVQQSFAKAIVSGGGDAGGLVGQLHTGEIRDSYARGNVNSNTDNRSGGLVGRNISGTIGTSYATGTVTGNAQLGGLIGENSGTVQYAYWDNQTSGLNVSAGSGSDNASARTTDQLQQTVGAGGTFDGLNTYVTWDNETVWELRNVYDYPRLRWQFFVQSVGFASGSDNETVQQSDNLTVVFSQPVNNATLTTGGTVRLTALSNSANVNVTLALAPDNLTLTLDPQTTLANDYELRLTTAIQALDGRSLLAEMRIPILPTADTDGDGLSDSTEAAIGTDPLLADTDGDGLSDQAENVGPTDPLVADYDGDGLNDGNETNLTYSLIVNGVTISGIQTSPILADTDGDGRNDQAEVDGYQITYTDTDNNTQTILVKSNPNATDTDGDGLTDQTEFTDGMNPSESDTDGDGLSDYQENSLLSSALDADTDNDGLGDAQEEALGSFPTLSDTDNDTLSDYAESIGFVINVNGDNRTVKPDPTRADSDGDNLNDNLEIGGVTISYEDINRDNISVTVFSDPSVSDTDNDSLTDFYEYNTSRTNPTLSDTDGDGLADNAEAAQGGSPLDADTDNDNVSDGAEVAAGSLLNDNDSDDDGLDDYLEIVTLKTNPRSSASDNDSLSDYDEYVGFDITVTDINGDNQTRTVKPDPTLTDTDGDGLIDSEERTRGLDPTLADTDGDGIDDQTEVNNATDGTDARDPADFNQITSGLVAYYRFNGDTSDFAGGDDNGTIIGDNVTLAADRFGVNDRAYQFNGDGYIEVAHRAENNLLDNFTITAWVYADNLSAAGTNEINGIFSKEGSTMGAYLYFKDEKLEGQGTKGGEAADFLSKWSFVVLRVVGGQVYLYQNGGQGKMLAFGATATSPAANNIEPIRIGEGFEGRIDDLRYYNRALTEVEIKYIYEKTLAADDERLPESQ